MMVPPALFTAVFQITSPPVPVPSIVPALKMVLASVRRVSEAVWFALMTPLAWFTRDMVAEVPICPAPEMMLLTLVSVFDEALPTIRLSVLFDIVSLPAP